ncbi:MAG: HD domain-containing phosphohydrolase [Phycisphaerales bacterium]|nr:HD domain-containing phosphohydrolase [Phycisphaerales bacterium]
MKTFGNNLSTPVTTINDLLSQLRSSGIVVVECTTMGKIKIEPKRGEDWFADLLLSSPIVRTAITSSCRTCLSNDKCDAKEAIPGLWLIPTPLSSDRRSSGFAVALIVAEELLASEYMHTLCQATNAEVSVIRDMIRDLPPAAPQDIPRLSSLFQLAWSSHRSHNENQSVIEDIGRELADSYEEINLLYTITGSMNSVNHPERFIELVCSELLKNMPYDWVGVQLRTGDRLPHLGNELLLCGDTRHEQTKLSPIVAAMTCDITPGTPIIAHSGDQLSERLGEGTIVVPIENDGKVIGILIAAEKQGTDTTVSSVDIKMLSATASQLGIFLENALLYEDLNATFLGTLEALTASIDAKDCYTCGHSQRVSLLTAQLAEAAGLSEELVDRYRIAGLVHDIGKIGVPESVLLKKGLLTNEEYRTVQQHPEIGARILRDIPQMSDILGGVLHHHERFDGSGYPHGLAEEEIPLVARMITLADTFDAMSSSRTYRNAMTRSSVIDEMKRSTPGQFDPILADIFFNLDFSQWEELMIEHQSGQANERLAA